ncbi:hypothetical protein BKP44_18030 [Formosa algae]|nr:hypothetical protein AST99_02665 [Formosa algae]PNW26110.1 hypothetical protein BKP44_18030 [Formosa algae]
MSKTDLVSVSYQFCFSKIRASRTLEAFIFIFPFELAPFSITSIKDVKKVFYRNTKHIKTFIIFMKPHIL